MESALPLRISQAQPDPNRDTPAAANCSLNFAKLSNVAVIAVPSAPDGSPPPPGAISVQNNEWFQWPPPLLRTAVRASSGTLLRLASNASSDFSCSAACLSSAAFR